jgi:CRISPR/Cas system-associated protein Cas10 (large subunit of type III CRISPR-Cas system)
MSDGDGLMWGVYEATCPLCGKELRIVATIHSVEEGYSEWHQGSRFCSECKEMYEND